jgi:hypothetical protein
MVRSLPAVLTLLAATLTLAGCGDDTPTTPTGGITAPVAITETVSDTLTVNGGKTHPFIVQQTGNAAVALTALSVEGATVGLSLGTWNGQVCQVILANDAAVQGNTVIGTATSTGNFCARIYDVGKLTGPVDYTLTITHF